MSELADCDDEAADLVRHYARAGEFCVVVRTRGDTAKPRLIFPQADVTKVSEWLAQASEILFNGSAH